MSRKLDVVTLTGEEYDEYCYARAERDQLAARVAELEAALNEAIAVIEDNHERRGICPDDEHERIRMWQKLLPPYMETSGEPDGKA